MHLCGITTNPAGQWVTQHARNLTGELEEAGRVVAHLIRDRDAKFTGPFDDVWRSIGARVIRIPVRGAQRERVRGALDRHRPSRVPRPSL